jgi:hypothetical protein
VAPIKKMHLSEWAPVSVLVVAGAVLTPASACPAANLVFLTYTQFFPSLWGPGRP